MCKNRLTAVRRRLSGAGGFTMTELLACTMIMLMTTSIITQTLISAMSYSQSQIWRSRAQNLCNLLTESVENVLLYAEKVKVDSTEKKISYIIGEDEYTIKEQDGKIVIEKNAETDAPYDVLNSQSYKQAKAKIIEATVENGPPKTLKITIEISPDPGGQHKSKVSNTFYVRPLIGNFAFENYPSSASTTD